MNPSPFFIAALLCHLLGAPAHASASGILADGAPAAADVGAARSSATLLADSPPALLLHLGLGALTGVLAVPTGLYLASWVGHLSNNLFAATLPSLLVMGTFAPTVVVLTAWAMGNLEHSGRFGYWAPWVASVLINAAALMVAGLLGLSIGAPLGVALFSVIDGVLVGGGAVGTMRAFSGWAPPVVTEVASFVPGITPTLVVPFASTRF